MTEQIDLIIDTDPGVDDALAIMLAASQSHVRLHALTVVAGNVGLAHTLDNACKILDVLDSDAKVYPGCSEPLVYAPDEDAAFVHGADGLGEADLPKARKKPEQEHAVFALIQMAREAPGKYTLAAIGPLTNVAMALRIEPKLPSLFKRLVVMGGAVTGQGNVSTVCAEFNIYSDPEAAHLVFSNWPAFDLVDWEATMRHDFPLDILDQWRKLGTNRAEFYHRISRKVVEFVTQREGQDRMRAADALALAATVAPSIIRKAEQRFVAVETHGSQTRGMTMVDWQSRSGHSPNARIILEVEQQGFLDLITQTLAIS